MCLIFLSIKQHPTYKLIIAANRDEFYARKTAPVAYWQDHPALLGGRDLEAQGTWMAMNTNGRIAMVTNYRDPKNINPKAPSRGQLVTDYLLGADSASSYLNTLEKRAKEYNGFNLIVGDMNELWYLSNYHEGVQKIDNGLHGLSNHLLETPWPKVQRGKEKLQVLLQDENINPSQLMDLLYDERKAPDDQLPETGVGLERERALSSMFIKMDGYGTRCSTILLVDNENNATYTERVYNLHDFSYTDRSFSLKV